MNNYSVMIDEKSIKRKLVYDGITYEDEMVKKRPGVWETTGPCIETMLDKGIDDGYVDMSNELWEGIDNNDFTEILELLNN